MVHDQEGSRIDRASGDLSVSKCDGHHLYQETTVKGERVDILQTLTVMFWASTTNCSRLSILVSSTMGGRLRVSFVRFQDSFIRYSSLENDLSRFIFLDRLRCFQADSRSTLIHLYRFPRDDRGSNPDWSTEFIHRIYFRSMRFSTIAWLWI